MTAEQDNAIRNVARRCNEAMKSAIKSAPKKTNIDTITRPILLSHYETINLSEFHSLGSFGLLAF